MEATLKERLMLIADQLTTESTLEDVYEHLSLLNDIEISEEQVKKGEVLSQQEVEIAAREWLK